MLYSNNHKTTTTSQVCQTGVVVMKGCTIILEPVLKYIVSVSESEKHISAELKKE